MAQPRNPFGDTFQRRRIAVIGGGLSGVTSAVECVDSGHNVVLYEASSSIGGVWSRVNSFSGLQIHGMTYMFHPEVSWSTSFPQRDEILDQIRQLWASRGGPEWTRFKTPVTSVQARPNDRWCVNGELYDALIIATGTCHQQYWPEIRGMAEFQGTMVHASNLDSVASRMSSVADKQVVIIGSGASGIEALEWSYRQGAAHTTMLSRTPKWIIPRNPLLHGAVSLMPRADHPAVAGVVRWCIGRFCYRKRPDLVPDYDFFKATPCCNDAFFELLDDTRRVDYLPAVIESITADGIVVRALDAKRTASADTAGLGKRLPGKVPQSPLLDDHTLVASPCSVAPPFPFSLDETASDDETIGTGPASVQSFASVAGSVSDADTFEDASDSESDDAIEFKDCGATAQTLDFIPADLVVLATGYARPRYDYMPEELRGVPDDLYMLGFHPDYPTCLFNNGTYVEGVATAASYHINVDTRLLLMFLADPSTRPDRQRAWAHVRQQKRPGFLTYANKIWWQVSFLLEARARWRHASHVLLGKGAAWVHGAVREVTKTARREALDYLRSSVRAVISYATSV